MPEKKKKLPKPPKTPFQKGRFEDSDENTPLLADRMAAALAKGKLDEFITDEFQDNKPAKDLAKMMLELCGMTPPAHVGSEKKTPEKKASAAGGKKPPPPDVTEAAKSGNVEKLMELLSREHGKRSPDVEMSCGKASTIAAEDKMENETQGLTEKEILDDLIRIADENNVSVDWVVTRALSLYARDYKLTGRL